LHTRDDSVLENPVWFAAEDGAWYAQFKLKKGGSKDSELRKWQKSTGSGYSWHITTLSLWDPK
jgi:hypothetical protein